MARTPSLKPGPAQITRAALAMIEGMKGEPLDEEIADVLADAVWDAFASGRDSARRIKPPRASAPGAAPENKETP